MGVKVELGGGTSTPRLLNFLIPGSAFGSPESLILPYSIVHTIKGPFKHYIQKQEIRARTSDTVLGIKFHMPLLILISIQPLPSKLLTVFLEWK